jgi:hypothetical protein
MTPHEAVARVITALKGAGLSHLVTGALASNHYGIERSTKDADIVLETAPGDFAAFANALGPDLALDAQVTFETITGSLRHIIALRGTPFKIELFLLGSDPHHQERFRRRRAVRLASIGVETWLPTAEDVVVQKVRWGRHKDLDDAQNVIAVQRDRLDWSYIERWCDAHGTRARLEEIRASIPPP